MKRWIKMKNILLGLLGGFSFFLIGCGQQPLTSDEFMEIGLETSRQTEVAIAELRESGQMHEYLTERFNRNYFRASSTYDASRIREIAIENDVAVIEVDEYGDDLTWHSIEAVGWELEEVEGEGDFTVTLIHPSKIEGFEPDWVMVDVYTVQPFETVREFQTWAEENNIELRVSMRNAEGVSDVHSQSHSAPNSTLVVNDFPYTLGIDDEGNFEPNASLTIIINHNPTYWGLNHEWLERNSSN